MKTDSLSFPKVVRRRRRYRRCAETLRVRGFYAVLSDPIIGRRGSHRSDPDSDSDNKNNLLAADFLYARKKNYL